jgi:(S)-2-hydroxyglutarate dehydrogenase
MDRVDVAIVGGGVIGCAVARALAARERTADEVATLEQLYERGTANGAVTRLITRAELLELEPHSEGISALHAPEGASLDARGFVMALAEDARSSNVRIRPGEKAGAIDNTTDGITIAVSTVNGSTEKLSGSARSNGVIARFLVNAAGLHADRVAHQFGCGDDYQIIPFRGDYYELVDNRRDLVRSHLYPAPDLAFPFLGVHFSRTFDGRVIVGPGARLALGRESYDEWSTSFRNLKNNWSDLASMASFPGFWSMVTSKDMRRLAKDEWKKALFKDAVAREGAVLIPRLVASDLKKASCGIRAQLVNRQGLLVDDLVLDETENSIHVLNAVSPALTCALPFADYVVEQIIPKL